MKPRELATCGVFGAAALLLPTVFHAVHLGHVFMPMYLPLVALAFFVRPTAAGLTAFVVPLLSGFATGMPPINPPVAYVMAVELSLMAMLIALVQNRMSPDWLAMLSTKVKYVWVLFVLVAVLAIGRVMNVALSYVFALAMGLPPKPIALLAFVSGWPGILLMLVVIPQLVILNERFRR